MDFTVCLIFRWVVERYRRSGGGTILMMWVDEICCAYIPTHVYAFNDSEKYQISFSLRLRFVYLGDVFVTGLVGV